MKVRLLETDLSMNMRGFKVGEVYDAEIVVDDDAFEMQWYKITDPEQDNLAMTIGVSDGTGGWMPGCFEVVDEGEDK